MRHFSFFSLFFCFSRYYFFAISLLLLSFFIIISLSLIFAASLSDTFAITRARLLIAAARA